jgi:urea transport system substrate-binding protein
VPGYEILAEVGRGGMGVVYKARQSKLNRLVALKMILSGGHAGEADLARFRTEAEAVARLQHPNFVQVYEIGEHGGLPYLSLEFCPGGSLEHRLAGAPLPPREAAALVEVLARAMESAHGKGVIHRDLKPANVLLGEHDTPKITDFGLAKKLDEVGPTVTGAVMGTPSYMAPEQAGGKSKEIGPACDTYALGAILYECLTGRPPFKAATNLDTILQVISEEPRAVRQCRPDVPRDLETICLKCLAKRPDDRYASAADLADDLRRFLQGEPIRGRRVGRGERALKWAKRRPAAALLLGLLGLAALALLLGAVWWSTSPPRGPGPQAAGAGQPAAQSDNNAPQNPEQGFIKVGILQSRSGPTAARERSLRDAELLAVDEINAQGGVLGKTVRPVVENPEGNFATGYPDKARKLLREDKVAALFGCWTTVNRKHVLPVLEEANGLLFYPAPYEGLESSRNVVYTGAVPNQQIAPAVRWLLENRGRKFFLLGSDYIYPRTVNSLVRAELKRLKGELVEEQYVPMTQFPPEAFPRIKAAVARVKATKPDVVFNTLEDEFGAEFFKEFDAAGIKPAETVVCSATLNELGLAAAGPAARGHLLASSYFQNVSRPENQAFVERFQSCYGKDRPVNDPIHAAYFQVFLWKLAVERANSTEVDKVREALRGLTLDAPGGKVKVDEENQHTWKPFRMGQVGENGQIKVIYESKGWLEPDPMAAAASR